MGRGFLNSEVGEGRPDLRGSHWGRNVTDLRSRALGERVRLIEVKGGADSQGAGKNLVWPSCGQKGLGK